MPQKRASWRGVFDARYLASLNRQLLRLKWVYLRVSIYGRLHRKFPRQLIANASATTLSDQMHLSSEAYAEDINPTTRHKPDHGPLNSLASCLASHPRFKFNPASTRAEKATVRQGRKRPTSAVL
jgi:hypothetical protein